MKRSLCAAGATVLLTLLPVPALGANWVEPGPTTPPQQMTAPAPEVSSNGRLVTAARMAQNNHGASPTSGPPLGLEYVYIDPATYGVCNFPWRDSTSALRFQTLYTKDQIGRSGNIHEMALYKSYYPTYYKGTFPNVTVKLCNTTATSLGTSFSGNYGGATPVAVFHADSLTRGYQHGSDYWGWDTVDFDTDFAYDSSKSLLVEITWAGSASGYTYTSLRYQAASLMAYHLGDTTSDTASTSYNLFNTRIGFVPPDNNVGVTAILEPHERYYPYGDTIFPQCIVENFGAAEQDSVPVQCKITDSATGKTVYNSVVYIASLAPDEVDTVNTFPGYLPPPTEAIYADTMRTENPGDARPGDDMQQFEFVVSLTGVMTTSAPIVNGMFTISPNPLMSGLATVRCIPPKDGSAMIEVFNASGRRVYSSFGIRNSEFRLDLRSMPAGVYMVKVATEGFSTTQKLVVE